MNTLRYRFSVILLIIFTTAISYAINRTPVDTITDIVENGSNNYYIISDEMIVRNDIKLGSGCVLCFEPGGRLVGVRKSDGQLPNLKLADTGTGVRAWDMCIFENITISGKFTNSYIPAEWFGTESMDDAEMINTALEQAPEYVIRLTRKDYSLDETIRMEQDYQRLEAAGRLGLNKDIPAIAMYKNHQQIDVGTIASNGSVWNALDTYKGKGVKLTGDTYHCDVSVRGLYGLDYGIYACYNKVEPDDPSSATQYTKINFNNINARNGIFIDRTNSTADTSFYAWFNENQINGGTIRSLKGITLTDPPNRPARWLYNGNVYRNITFLMDTCDRAIYYTNVQQDYFRDISLRERAPKDSKYFEFKSCDLLHLTTTSSLPYTRIKAERDNFNVILDGCITDDGINRYLGSDRIVAFLDSAWGQGNSTRYVTSRIQPYNMVNVIETKNADLTLEPKDLFPTIWNPYSPINGIGDDIQSESFDPEIIWGTHVLSGLCYLRPKNGKQITLDISGRRPYFNIPIDVVIDQADGRFAVKYKDSGLPIYFLGNGVFRLTLNENLEPEFVRLSR